MTPCWEAGRERVRPRRRAAGFYRVRDEIDDATVPAAGVLRSEKDRLIQPGVPLAEAEKLVKDFGQGICRRRSPAM